MKATKRCVFQPFLEDKSKPPACDVTAFEKPSHQRLETQTKPNLENTE